MSPPAISSLGQVTTTQGNGNGDTTTVNNTTFRLSYTGTQGNGDGDSVIDAVAYAYEFYPPRTYGGRLEYTW